MKVLRGKKLIVTIMSVCLVGGAGVVAACAPPAAPTSTPTSTAKSPAPTSTPTPAAKPIELSFAHWSVVGGGWANYAVVDLSKDIEKRTNGRVKFTIFGGGALTSGPTAYEAAVKGLADISWFGPAQTPGRFPMTDVLALPFVYPSGEVGSKVAMDLFDLYLYKEYPDTKMLGLYAGSPYWLYSNKKVSTPADMKGMRIAVASPLVQRTVELLGGVPVFMLAAETYTSFQRNLVDGGLQPGLAADLFKLTEVSKYVHTGPFFSLGTTINGYAVNIGSWNKLPPDIQKIVADTFREWQPKIGAFYDQEDARLFPLWQAKGTEIIRFSPEQVALFMVYRDQVANEFAGSLEKKGFPGRELVDKANELAKKYYGK